MSYPIDRPYDPALLGWLGLSTIGPYSEHPAPYAQAYVPAPPARGPVRNPFVRGWPETGAEEVGTGVTSGLRRFA